MLSGIYVVRCDFTKTDTKIINKHFKEIGLHVLNMITILSSVININGVGLYDHLMHTQIFNLITDTIFTYLMSSKTIKELATTSNLVC